MRLATIHTSRGLRLHVAGAAGYVDVADASGDPRLTGWPCPRGRAAAFDAIRQMAFRDGTAIQPADFGPAVPEPPRILCLA